jgi:predicted acylesterase/phospholipase RssA
MNGGAGARALFRDVLVASASVPGLFPPVVIRVQEQQALYDEVHVDGTISLPFFVPPALVEPTQGAGQQPTVYVIVDGRLSERSVPIRLRARSILSRSVSAGLNHLLRTNLELTATDAQHEGAQFEFAAIPAAYPQGNAFDFRTASMRSLFQFGYRCAEAGRLWTSSASAGQDPNSGDSGAGSANPCPADDQFIGRLAVR